MCNKCILARRKTTLIIRHQSPKCPSRGRRRRRLDWWWPRQPPSRRRQWPPRRPPPPTSSTAAATPTKATSSPCPPAAAAAADRARGVNNRGRMCRPRRPQSGVSTERVAEGASPLMGAGPVAAIATPASGAAKSAAWLSSSARPA